MASTGTQSLVGFSFSSASLSSFSSLLSLVCTVFLGLLLKSSINYNTNTLSTFSCWLSLRFSIMMSDMTVEFQASSVYLHKCHFPYKKVFDIVFSIHIVTSLLSLYELLQSHDLASFSDSSHMTKHQHYIKTKQQQNLTLRHRTIDYPGVQVVLKYLHSKACSINLSIQTAPQPLASAIMKNFPIYNM